MSAPELSVALQALDGCFEGGVPATLCTCSADGTPNLGFLSVVHRVDQEHIALSFQFFRKTRKNIAENPTARLLVVEPNTGIEYRLSLLFVGMETGGPTFDELAARTSAIASQTGMQDTFGLRGADLYRVTACERVDNGVQASLPEQSTECLAQLASCSTALSGCSDLEQVLHVALEQLELSLGYSHSFLMAADESARTLFSVASRGYSPSGVGAELQIGDGLIGKAAEQRRNVRVANMRRERIFAEAVHSGDPEPHEPPRTVPLPGLQGAQSQLAVPLLAQGQLLGVLCVQSERAAAYSRVDEQLVRVIADQVAARMVAATASTPSDELVEPNTSASPSGPASTQPPACVRYYADDDSIFVDSEYLIRGVAGRVLWLLLQSHAHSGRTEFTNRQLRLEPSLGLPPIKDNLETRLIMLRKRLQDKCPTIQIPTTGRGRFKLHLKHPVELEQS